MNYIRESFWRLLVSAGVSFFVIALLFQLVSHEGDATMRANLAEVLLRLSLPLVAIFVVCQLSQTFLRSERYRLLIAASGPNGVPSRFHMFLVTAARNMFVDMLPARLGEFSYVALLNRGHNISGQRCLTSLSLSLLFDFVALLALAVLVISLPLASSDIRGLMLATLLVVTVLVILLGLALFSGVKWAVQLSRFLPGRLRHTSFFQRLLRFMEKLAEAFEETKRAGVFWNTFLLSLGVRVFKYAGLYCAFLAVAVPSFTELANAPFSNVLIALLAAEASASLPIPTFMSFGAYEAGGLLALKLLGFSAAGSAIAMLGIHIVTQCIDYTVGGIGLVIFLLTTRGDQKKGASRPRRQLVIAAVGVLVLLLGVGFFLMQYRSVKKLGSITTPPPGAAVQISPAEREAIRALTRNLNGFMVWSSNRYGSHDILLRTFPDLATKQLTKHPHTDTFPRISPDGARVVFCRSQVPWVSQRDPLPWDVYIVNVESGEERLVAKNGNTPTWSEDGTKVYFQRNAGEFVECHLESGQENVLFASGRAAIPTDVQLHTPDYNARTGQLAVTLRSRPRITALYGPDGHHTAVGGGSQCQLAWSRNYSHLYLIDNSQKNNRVYRFFPDTGQTKLWLDLTGRFNHEYFPRQSNDGAYLILGASRGKDEHEHDSADYEIFLWRVGSPHEDAVRLTFHTGNDNWSDLYVSH